MGPKDKEFESKFFADFEHYSAILDCPKIGTFKRIKIFEPSILDHYFDTAHLDLTVRGAVYRHRRIDERDEGTFKEQLEDCMDGTIHLCTQIEQEIPPGDLESFLIHTLANRPFLALRDFLERIRVTDRLETLFYSQNRRTAILFEYKGTAVEVDLDFPRYQRNDETREIRILEAEFKGGDYDTYRGFNDLLEKKFGLTPCRINKIQLGVMLFNLRVGERI